MNDTHIIYNRYDAILGKLRDDKIISEDELQCLNKAYLEAGNLSTIKNCVDSEKELIIMEFLKENFNHFWNKNK